MGEPASIALLRALEVALRSRGHVVVCDGAHLHLNDAEGVILATARSDGRLSLSGAMVWNGDVPTMPPGLGRSVVTPGRAKASVDALVAAVEARLAARAASSPPPADPTAITRAPDDRFYSDGSEVACAA